MQTQAIALIVSLIMLLHRQSVVNQLDNVQLSIVYLQGISLISCLKTVVPLSDTHSQSKALFKFVSPLRIIAMVMDLIRKTIKMEINTVY